MNLYTSGTATPFGEVRNTVGSRTPCPVLCPTYGRSALTSYSDHKCRCDVCKVAMSAYKRNYRQDKARAALHSAKNRAQKNGVVFTLTLKDVPPVPKYCPVFGIEMKVKQGRVGGAAWNSPSLDRINPCLGYVAGNVQWLSQQANTMKHNATPEQLIQFARWVLSA